MIFLVRIMFMNPDPHILKIQVCIVKMLNKNIEIGFQSAVSHLCQRALVPLLRNDRGLYLGLGKATKTFLIT